MSYRSAPPESDHATKARRYDGASDVSAARYGTDRWTPNERATPSVASSTSGFIHPSRQVPLSSSASASATPSSSSSSYNAPARPSYQQNMQGGGGGWQQQNRGYPQQSSHNNYNNPHHTPYNSNPHNRPPPQNYHVNRTGTSNSSLSLSSASHPCGSKPSSTASITRPSSSSTITAGPTKAELLEQERLAEEQFQRRMQEKMAELEESEEKTEEQLAAEREAKRKAILAKYHVKAEPPPAQVLSEDEKKRILDAAGAIEVGVTATTAVEAPSAVPATSANTQQEESKEDSSAMQIDHVPAHTSAAPAPAAPAPTSTPAPSLAAMIDSYDMFSDDALAPEVEAGLGGERDVTAGTKGGDADAYDDSEGYYRYRLGDLLEGGRYRVTGLQGSGVFSTVLRVRELIPGQSGAPSTEGRELVVKLIRSNETMFAAGQKELEYLKLLAAGDPENKKHVVRLLAHFMHRGHLCLVFEPLFMDLRKVIKKFGSVGISLRAVRSYAKQLMIALKHMKKCQILHGDIKPDNMLCNQEMNIVKIADLGSAGKLNEQCEITPYLVSRFYRAPEIMLGMKYDAQIDLWSVGCTLFELYTGKILFSGTDNNSMLKSIQDVKGRFPKKMLSRGQFTHQHFDADGVFEWKKVDSVTHQEMRQKIRYSEKPNKDLYHMLKTMNDASLTTKELAQLKLLADFIHCCIVLDPSQRPTCETLLQHEFIIADL